LELTKHLAKDQQIYKMQSRSTGFQNDSAFVQGRCGKRGKSSMLSGKVVFRTYSNQLKN
jgi:hypothetical protein